MGNGNRLVLFDARSRWKMGQAGPHEYLAFDLETTGLHAARDRVVEVGAVRFDASGRELGRFTSLINPQRPMSPGAQAVNGISDFDLASAPLACEVLPAFLAFVGDPGHVRLLAHNASFDAGFLGMELARLAIDSEGYFVTDTLALARSRLPHLKTHRLDALTRLLGLAVDQPHRALADSIRVKELWLALKGVELEGSAFVSYPVFNANCAPVPAPEGWDAIKDAILRGARLRMEYTGGTQGTEAREITPRSFSLKGGVPYLVALCQVDGIEKSFRLDRVRWYEVIA
jgi:DNA polymerase III subunit epsilon